MHFNALRSRKFWREGGGNTFFERKTGGGESTMKKDFLSSVLNLYFCFTHYTHVQVRVLMCVSVCAYACVHVYIRIGPACRF